MDCRASFSPSIMPDKLLSTPVISGLLLVGAIAGGMQLLRSTKIESHPSKITEGDVAWLRTVTPPGSRPVALFFGGDWCGACVRWKSEVLPHPVVTTALSRFDFVAVDPAVPANAPSHAFKSTAYVPEIVIVTRSGDRLAALDARRLFGSPSALARDLTAIADRESRRTHEK